MNKTVEKWIDDHREEMVAALQKCISFRTVRDTDSAGPGVPFGPELKECLDHILRTADTMGLESKNLDGYCGYAQFGSGEEQLGIFVHLDVVPEGDGWIHPPYSGKIDGPWLYGRGALDDKGPAVAALYAMAAVKSAGLPARRSVRLILGCDEESQMACLRHYKQVEPLPDLAFSPDAQYPLVNCEKAIYGAVYQKAFSSQLSLQAGTVSNAVPDKAVCRCYLSADAVSHAAQTVLNGSPFHWRCQKAEKDTLLTISGKAAHASTPEEGHNALCAMLAVLKQLPLSKEDADTAAGLADVLQYDHHGESFGLDCADASGRLTLNAGVINWNESGIQRLSVDIRAPISAEESVITEKLQAGFSKSGLCEERHSYSPGYRVDPDSELIRSLITVYHTHLDPGGEPLSIGGGTYARHLKNAVAFGPERPGEEAPIHMANERILIDHFIEDAKIYADAIIALACTAE